MEALILILAVSVRIIAAPAANALQKQLTHQDQHPLVVNLVTFLLLSAGCLLFMRTDTLAGLPILVWQYSILGGLAGALGNGFLVMALKRGELSVLGPINAWKSVVGIAGGILLLQEIPTLWSIAGIVLIIAGSYRVLDTTPERFTWQLFKRSDIQFRLAAMVLTAIEAVLIKQVIAASTPLIAFAGWSWFGGIFTLLLLIGLKPSALRLSVPFRPEFAKRYLLLAASMGLMQIATNYTFKHMDVGPALALFQLSTLVSVILGYKLFNEKSLPQKLIGAALMVAGSAIIILFGSPS